MLMQGANSAVLVLLGSGYEEHDREFQALERRIKELQRDAELSSWGMDFIPLTLFVLVSFDPRYTDVAPAPTSSVPGIHCGNLIGPHRVVQPQC